MKLQGRVTLSSECVSGCHEAEGVVGGFAFIQTTSRLEAGQSCAAYTALGVIIAH